MARAGSIAVLAKRGDGVASTLTIYYVRRTLAAQATA